jgi:DNA-binding CsgD family transcriptional regulator
MKDFGRIPWLKVHDYLLQVESCATPREFMLTASAEVQKLIPYDIAAGFFSTNDGKSLEAIGPPVSVKTSYNTYYRTRQPSYLSGLKGHDHWDVPIGPVTNWYKHKNLEYAVDFMIPNELCKGLTKTQGPFALLTGIPEQQITLAIFRSRLAPDFTDTDVAILDVLNQHLGNLYKILHRKEELAGPALSVQAITERFHSLSRREAELCCLLARRLNTAEIGAYLFISPRTVERHIENIFEKLDVRSREQLRTTLGVETGTGSRTGYSARPNRTGYGAGPNRTGYSARPT